MIKQMTTKQALDLYDILKKDFPPGEIPSFVDYQKRVEQQDYEVYSYLHNEVEKAYLVCREKQNSVVLLFFAVTEKDRGQGVGTRCLQEFIASSKQKDGIIIEVERIEDALNAEEKRIRQKRIHFYERLGFKKIEQIQYELYHIKLDLMLLPLRKPNMSLSQIIEIMRQVYHDISQDTEVFKITYKISE